MHIMIMDNGSQEKTILHTPGAFLGWVCATGKNKRASESCRTWLRRDGSFVFWWILRGLGQFTRLHHQPRGAVGIVAKKHNIFITHVSPVMYPFSECRD